MVGTIWRILYKAEPTGCLMEFVQAHDNPLHFPTHGEELINLLLSGVEGKVAHIESGANIQLLLVLIRRNLRNGNSPFLRQSSRTTL